MAEDIKTQDITKATEALLTDLLLATTQPTTGNPENKNISIELLKELINQEVKEEINKLRNTLDEKVKELIKTDETLIKKTKGIIDMQGGKETCAFTEELQSKVVNFPRQMLGGSTPSVVVTIGGGSSWTKVLHVTASSENRDGFTLNYVSDNGSGNISVSWIAYARE